MKLLIVSVISPWSIADGVRWLITSGTLISDAISSRNSRMASETEPGESSTASVASSDGVTVSRKSQNKYHQNIEYVLLLLKLSS